MKTGFDFSKEYGIVLEGGGAKGAYQVGVWKALKECGVKIKGVAGVSVGALNGVLICMDDIELAENLWNNISYSKVMDVDDEEMDHLLKLDIRNMKLKKITVDGAKAVTSGGIDITPLRQLLDHYVDEEKIRNSEIELIFGAVNLSDMKNVEIEAKSLEQGKIKDYLIASSSLPVFKQEKLQGKTYLDGGIVNNVPINLLIKRGYKDIIVVRIFGIGVEKKVKIPENVHVIEIYPRVELGNILEFNHQKTSRNMKIGYYDAMRALKSLQGKIYYIANVKTEEQHMLLFMNMNQLVKMALIEYFKEEYDDESLYNRKIFEVVLPGIAVKLGLPKGWTYTELYLSMLELSAKSLKIRKYHVYTEDDLVEKIKTYYAGEKYRIYQDDIFVKLIIWVIAIS